MSLDSLDYTEPCCCFDASGYTGTPDTAPCAQPLDIKSIISELDRLLNSGNESEAGRFLDLWCGRARDADDWRTELSLQSELMGFHRRTGDEKSAINAVNRGLELIREHHLGSTVSGATVLLNAATTLKAYGRADKSIPMFIQVCRVFSEKLDPLDYRFGGLFNNMALSYSDVGDFDSAESYFKKALAVISHCEHPENELAVTCCNLAELYERMGRDEDIEPMLDRAWEYLNSPDLPHNGYHAFTASKCLPTFEHFGFFIYAHELKARVNSIYERT